MASVGTLRCKHCFQKGCDGECIEEIDEQEASGDVGSLSGSGENVNLAASGILPSAWQGRSVACKQPMVPSAMVLEEEKEVSLEEYFALLGTDTWDRIRLCRTYANYLAAGLGRERKRAKQ